MGILWPKKWIMIGKPVSGALEGRPLEIALANLLTQILSILLHEALIRS